MSESVKISQVVPRKVWIESDFLGARHVVAQYEMAGMKPFVFATFHYHHAYTSNHSTLQAAEELARQLGASDPIEHRSVAVAGQK